MNENEILTKSAIKEVLFARNRSKEYYRLAIDKMLDKNYVHIVDPNKIGRFYAT